MEFWITIFGLKEPTVTYCELATNSLIARPGYFISNFAYIAGGIYLLTRKSKIEKIFGVISILIGIFSGIYDASFKFNAQILDLGVMFLFVNLVLILNIKRIFAFLNNNSLISLFIVFESIYLILIAILEKSSGRIFFGVFVLLTVISELYIIIKKSNKLTEYKYWLAGLLLFLLGFAIWLLDANQIWCDPTNIFNGRGVYHYLTALTVVLIARHYKINSKI